RAVDARQRVYRARAPRAGCVRVPRDQRHAARERDPGGDRARPPGRKGHGAGVGVVRLNTPRENRTTASSTPATADRPAHSAAFRLESCAPAQSPTLHFELTWEAYTVDTMPPGRQPSSVARTPPTRLV